MTEARQMVPTRWANDRRPITPELLMGEFGWTRDDDVRCVKSPRLRSCQDGATCPLIMYSLVEGQCRWWIAGSPISGPRDVCELVALCCLLGIPIPGDYDWVAPARPVSKYQYRIKPLEWTEDWSTLPPVYHAVVPTGFVTVRVITSMGRASVAIALEFPKEEGRLASYLVGSIFEAKNKAESLYREFLERWLEKVPEGEAK